MNAGELCSKDVVVAYRDTGLIEAAQLMREHHVGSLVVVGERQLPDKLPIGMITDRDIVVAAVAKEVDPRTLTVGDVMTGGALTVREQDGIEHAVRVMREKGVRRVAVVSAKGTLVGILAIDDVLALVAEQMDGFVGTLISERSREVRQRR